MEMLGVFFILIGLAMVPAAFIHRDTLLLMPTFLFLGISAMTGSQVMLWAAMILLLAANLFMALQRRRARKADGASAGRDAG